MLFGFLENMVLIADFKMPFFFHENYTYIV